MERRRRRNLRWADEEQDPPPTADRTEFDTHNQIEGKSEKTRDWYNDSLGQFLAYLKDQGLSTMLGDLGVESVQDFILHLQSKRKWDDHPYIPSQKEGLSPVSVRTKVRAIRAFFSWLHGEGFTHGNRLANLKPPKAPRKLVRVLTPDEIRGLMLAIDRQTTLGSRNFALLALLLDTGVRVSEVANLEMENVLMDSVYVKVFGKGSKERTVPVVSWFSVKWRNAWFELVDTYPFQSRLRGALRPCACPHPGIGLAAG